MCGRGTSVEALNRVNPSFSPLDLPPDCVFSGVGVSPSTRRPVGANQSARYARVRDGGERVRRALIGPRGGDVVRSPSVRRGHSPCREWMEGRFPATVSRVCCPGLDPGF